MLTIAASILGCGKSEPLADPLRTDEVRGSVGGVTLGDDKAEVARRFGGYEKPAEAYPIEPLEIDDEDGSGGYGNPWSVVTGPHHLGPGGLGGEQVTLRYREASFFVRDNRVFGFLITDPGAVTLRGIRTGDDLEDAEETYPELVCEEESQGETTAVQKASCSGRVKGGLSLYFGGDPIESIAVMERSFDSYDY